MFILPRCVCVYVYRFPLIIHAGIWLYSSLGFSVGNGKNDYIKSIAEFGVVVENRFPNILYFFSYFFLFCFGYSVTIFLYHDVYYVNLKLK